MEWPRATLSPFSLCIKLGNTLKVTVARQNSFAIYKLLKLVSLLYINKHFCYCYCYCSANSGLGLLKETLLRSSV